MSRRSWLVKSDTKRLPLDLPGEEWIEVKTELTVKEKRKIRYAGFERMRNLAMEPGKEDAPSVEVQIDYDSLERARVLTWLTDWSLLDPNEKPLPLTEANLDGLYEEAFRSIVRALDAHVESVTPKKTESPEEASGSGGASRLKMISS